MKKVKIDELKPGMILAAPVVIGKSMVLLEQGIALTSQHIKKIKNKPIDFISVYDENDLDVLASHADAIGRPLATIIEESYAWERTFAETVKTFQEYQPERSGFAPGIDLINALYKLDAKKSIKYLNERFFEFPSILQEEILRVYKNAVSRESVPVLIKIIREFEDLNFKKDAFELLRTLKSEEALEELLKHAIHSKVDPELENEYLHFFKLFGDKKLHSILKKFHVLNKPEQFTKILELLKKLISNQEKLKELTERILYQTEEIPEELKDLADDFSIAPEFVESRLKIPILQSGEDLMNYDFKLDFSNFEEPTGLFVDTEINIGKGSEKEINESFEQIYNENLEVLLQFINGVRQAEAVDIEEMKVVVNRIIKKSLIDKNACFQLIKKKGIGNYILHHSLNVAILSIMLAERMGYEADKIALVGLGALLHDIGMTFIPSNIWKKPGKLDTAEFLQIQKHTIIGVDILLDISEFIGYCGFIAYQHHENMDGTGYPKARGGYSLLEYSRLIAIADAYEAMTSPRVYRRQFTPPEAIRTLVIESGKRFDRKIVKKFIELLTFYPVGTVVELSNGELGRVVKVNHDKPLSPVVRVTFTKKLKKLEIPKIYNLLTVKSVFVKKALTYNDLIQKFQRR